MEIKTYRASSMQEAIALVRRELGPDASILHTRQASSGLLGWLGGRQIEVTASNDLPVPSRFETPSKKSRPPNKPPQAKSTARTQSADAGDYRERYREALKSRETAVPSVVETLSDTRSSSSPRSEALRALRESGFSHSAATGLLGPADESQGNVHQLLAAAKDHLAQSFRISGPIRVTRGSQQVVALVGPTGVGKTTTIAKLAAHYRLKEKLNVGLITVDTYRIAAVDQLRTYAEIIDLPMEVVATPREMRSAIAKLAAMDLILIDTAGRSPHDQSQLQELRSLLAEAHPHETQLVLSAVAGEASLHLAAQRFEHVGVDSLLLTKLDEAVGLGSLQSLLATHRLPLTYFTHGQNVPHDIRPASATKLAEAMVTGYLSRSEYQ